MQDLAGCDNNLTSVVFQGLDIYNIIGDTWIRNGEGKPQMDSTAVSYPLFMLKPVNQLLLHCKTHH